jgi:hypothetical protein
VLALQVKLLASAAALLCVLVTLPTTAAAARADRQPFDFELAPSAAVAAAGASRAGASVVSRRLPTGRRFNLVGMRWRGRAEPRVELRVRRPERGWSRWQQIAAHADHNPDPHRGERVASASDPLWVGSADGVQYRLSRQVRGLRLHFVNVAGVVARRRARAGAAQEPQPDFVSRAAWGAGGCPPRESPDYGNVKAVHVHHTVSLNDYSPAEARAMVLAICRYHRNSNGWDDVGYNALVDKYGVLYEGRAGGLDRAVIGAQAQGFNSETAGIASIADHTSVGATQEALDALARYIRWKLGVHGQPLSGPVELRSSGGSATRYPAGARVTLQRVIGHRDTGRTACPGQLLYNQLDVLRALVSTGVAGAPGPEAPGGDAPGPGLGTRLRATLADRWVDFGQVVPVTGLLSGPDGLPLADEPLELQVNGDGRWLTSRRLATGVDGTFTTELKPHKRLYVRLRYPGGDDGGRASSTRLLLRLRPRITLRRPARRGRRGVPIRLQGTVAPRKRTVHLILQQHLRGRFRRVAVTPVPARRGHFRTTFLAAFNDRYRYAVVAKADDDTDRGATDWIPLRVR